MRVYHERLRVPVSWWVLGMVSVLTLGGGFLAGFDWEPALAVYGTLTVSLAAILIGWGLLRLEVADGELRVGRDRLPLAQAGEVSALISDNGGHYVYKVVSKEVLPLDKVSNEIHNTLKTQRLKDGMEKYQNSYHTETNEAYFGPPQPMGGRPPGQLPPHMPHPAMGQPGPGAGAATPQQAAPPAANAPAPPAPSSKPN